MTPNANAKILAEFSAHERQRIGELAASGELVDLTRMAQLLEVSPQAVREALVEHRLFYLSGPSGETLFPAFFASAHPNHHLLEMVSARLGHLPGTSKWQFFTSPRLSLNGITPIEALKLGKVDNVMAAAAAFVEA